MTTRTALITGASRGLGRALAHRLSTDGWHLILDARRHQPLRELADSLAGSATIIEGDVASRAHRHELARAVRAHGGLDLLVNNAGTLGPTPLPPLATTEPADLADTFDVNTVAPLGLFIDVLPLLEEVGGTVVNITSDAAANAYPGWGVYGASKAALEHISAQLGVEHPDLRVYAFDPGDMRTDMHQAAFPGEDISDRPLPESVVPALIALVENRPPSGRIQAADLLTRSTS